MVNVRNIEDINGIKGGSIVTVGMFDGVHLGHQHILRTLTDIAAREGRTAVVVTFDRHPRQVIDDGFVPRMLCTASERIEKIGACGVEELAMVHFDRNTASMSACAFAERYLCGRLSMKGLVLGYDNVFGSRAVNDFDRLPILATQKGFSIMRDDAVRVAGVDVSSTKIRGSLQRGDMETARAMLGESYSVSGTVVHGHHVGSTLGFPTANVVVDDPAKIIPCQGVYAMRAEFGGRVYAAMANLGAQPTFHQERPVLEVHLIGFNGDLYGKKLKVSFVRRLRDIVAFPDTNALVEQLKKDLAVVSDL